MSQLICVYTMEVNAVLCCLSINILQNIFWCILKKIETHTGLTWPENEGITGNRFLVEQNNIYNTEANSSDMNAFDRHLYPTQHNLNYNTTFYQISYPLVFSDCTRSSDAGIKTLDPHEWSLSQCAPGDLPFSALKYLKCMCIPSSLSIPA